MRIVCLSLICLLALPWSLPAAGDTERFEQLVEVARAEVRLGEAAQAAARLEEALSIPSVKDEKRLDIFYDLASMYSDDLGDTAMAIDTYLRIIEGFEKSGKTDAALYRTGMLLEETGQPHNAAGFYERIIVEYPESEYAGYALEGSERCFQRNFDEVAATVRGRPITVLELEAAIEELPPVYKSRYSTPEGRKEFLDKMVRDRIVELHAREAGFIDDPRVVASLREARMRILNEEFFAREVRDSVQVSEKEVQEYYEAHKQEYKKPEEVKVRHILTETEEEARRILGELEAGKSFEDLAADFSIDIRTNERGGDLGFITRGRTVKEVEEVAFALETGQVSDVVKSRFGYHIVKVEEKRPESTRSLEDMRQLVVGEVRRLKEEERSRRLMAELAEKYEVRIFGESE
jgi:peptidyl-prolyl cis-trans isomerase C